MKIAGIDIDSRKFGVVLLEDNLEPTFVFFESKSKNVQERIFDLHDEFDKLVIKGLKPDKIFIEEAIYIQNFKTSKSISESIGNCKLLCRLNTIPFQMVPNKTWKKHIVGNGNATKEDIKNFIVKQHPELCDEPQDIFDAFCIALFGTKKEDNGRLE